tara:strand:- start:15 stop:803 length:789 start_codon:yes stop_codon:yes gene_type:complete
MNLLYYKFILSQTFALLISLFIGLLISLTYFGKVYGDTKIFSTQETSKIKELILETLLEKPEVLIEMSQLLKKKEAQASQEKVKLVIKENKNLLFNNDNAPVIGNKDGNVTIIEFFDYNCVYCKRAIEPLKKILAKDNNIRFVLREWPVLNEGSIYAAKAALASRKQGLYEIFHFSLMNTKRVTKSSTLSVAREVGLDLDKLKKDMKSPKIELHINNSRKLASALGFSGTPSFLIGEQTVPGLIPLKELERLVKKARSNKNE